MPRPLADQIGKTHYTRSLGTGDMAQAVRSARLVAADFERMLAAGGQDCPSPAPQPAMLRSPPPRVALPADRTFAELFALFQADPSRQRAVKTDMIYDNLFEVVSGVWGADAPLRSLDREACRELLEVLRWLPSNTLKRFPDLPVVEAARMARAEKLRGTLSAASINGYMSKLKCLFNFAVNEGWLDRNPAKGLRVVDPVRRRDKRLPFSTQQLRLIFNAPIYTGCLDDEWHYAVPGQNRPRRGRFWVPLIALFGGLRLNEACQLDVADIQIVEGVACVSVSDGSPGDGSDKRLKTVSSERFVPIHPALREIGLLSFVDAQRRAGHRKLFPELRASSTGYYSDPFSKWFRRFLDKAGASRPKTCFHSFRHSYRDALREARIDHEMALALGGWTSAGGKEDTEVAAAYGRGYRLPTLLQAIEKVSYAGLDLSHLRPSGPPPSVGVPTDLIGEGSRHSEAKVEDPSSDDQARRAGPGRD